MLSLIGRLGGVAVVAVFVVGVLTSSDTLVGRRDSSDERVVPTSVVTCLDSFDRSLRLSCCSFALARDSVFDAAPRRDSGGKWASAALCRSGHRRLRSGEKLGVV